MENPPPYSVASSSMATEKLNLNNLDVTSNSSVEPMAGTPSSSLPVSIVYNIPATNSRTAGPSTSSNNGFFSDAQQRPKDVNFTIHFNNRMHNIVISDHATMGELKTRIYEATNVPPCRQALKGFMPFRHRDAQNAQAILKNLNVARDNVLDLTDLTDLTDDG